MVCDEQGGISIWDYEKGNCNVHYNGQQKGSRMTSACWINEQTRSLFFVGYNDGSARFWSHIVSAMLTAWDEDLGLNQGGYSGMGPDIVIAGHSDGSLKLFDIRNRNSVDQIGNRPRRYTKFAEHRSWIVDPYLFGGLYEP